jgi:hypothetical protein
MQEDAIQNRAARTRHKDALPTEILTTLERAGIPI